MLFVAYWEDPLLILTNVTDEDGYVSVRTITPDRKEVSEIQVPARGRAELDNADPMIRGFLEVKAYVTDIRSVLEHDRPGKGLTREMGYLVDSSSHYILGVGVPALVASTIVL